MPIPFANILQNARPYQYDVLYSDAWLQSSLSQIGLDEDSRQKILQYVRIRNGKCIITKESLCQQPIVDLLTSTEQSDRAIYAILVLMWGHASQGYRDFRMRRIITSNNLTTIATTVDSAFSYLKDNQLRDAYLSFINSPIRFVGESFFTKILYFLSKHPQSLVHMAPIKDMHTSRAATAWGEQSVLERSVDSYLKYYDIVKKIANDNNISMDRVEEVFFEASRDKLLENDWIQSEDESQIIPNNQEDDEFSPLIFLEQNNFASLEDILNTTNQCLRVFIIADGKPLGNLAPMTYGPPIPTYSVLGQFYSVQRQGIIRNSITGTLGNGFIPFIATTGFGLIPCSAKIPRYNVAGEIAVRSNHYRASYTTNVNNWLTYIRRKSPETRISIIYYAGKSQREFRAFVWDAISNWIALDNNSAGVMYGANQHVTGWQPAIRNLFNWLCASGIPAPQIVPPPLVAWHAQAANVHPFISVA